MPQVPGAVYSLIAEIQKANVSSLVDDLIEVLPEDGLSFASFIPKDTGVTVNVSQLFSGSILDRIRTSLNLSTNGSQVGCQAPGGLARLLPSFPPIHCSLLAAPSGVWAGAAHRVPGGSAPHVDRIFLFFGWVCCCRLSGRRGCGGAVRRHAQRAAYCEHYRPSGSLARGAAASTRVGVCVTCACVQCASSAQTGAALPCCTPARVCAVRALCVRCACAPCARAVAVHPARAGGRNPVQRNHEFHRGVRVSRGLHGPRVHGAPGVRLHPGSPRARLRRVPGGLGAHSRPRLRLPLQRGACRGLVRRCGRAVCVCVSVGGGGGG